MDEIVFKQTESNFAKIRCTKCKNEQVIFTKAASKVNCLVCGEVLSEPTGGKSKILAEVIEKYS
jgi:small subunit ribosomal protein S27e